MANTPKPITREEMYYDYLINGGDIETLPDPITRREIYLNYLCQNGFDGGGDVTTEMLDKAVADALKSANDYTDDIISDYALVSDTGYSLGLVIDKDYIMTIELKNASGKLLSSKSVDFPIESMVVGAEYEKGIITLSLQNGDVINVDVSSLVNGLVNDTFTIAGIDMQDDITAEELKTALGINDLKAVAFSGSYEDLSDKPTAEDIEAFPGSIKLTNENLNEIRTPGVYYASQGNTVQNKPPGVDWFGFVCLKRAGTSFLHILYTTPTEPEYRRSSTSTGAPGNWIPSVIGVKGNAESKYRTGNVNITTDDIGAFPGVIKLTNEDLNTIKTLGFYFGEGGNTVTNKPSGMDYFGLICMRQSGTGIMQIIMASASSSEYRRTFSNNAWSGWVSNVLGVKGNAESSYRKGNVNLTPANIGAVSVADGDNLQAQIDASNTRIEALEDFKGEQYNENLFSTAGESYGGGMYRKIIKSGNFPMAYVTGDISDVAIPASTVTAGDIGLTRYSVINGDILSSLSLTDTEFNFTSAINVGDMINMTFTPSLPSAHLIHQQNGVYGMTLANGTCFISEDDESSSYNFVGCGYYQIVERYGGLRFEIQAVFFKNITPGDNVFNISFSNTTMIGYNYDIEINS